MLVNRESSTYVRISDFVGVIPAITGKVELVYEGEQEGPAKVAQILIRKAIKTTFENYFPSPEKIKKQNDPNPYQQILTWFGTGNKIDLLNNLPESNYRQILTAVPGLKETVEKYYPDETEQTIYLHMEFILHALAEYSLLNKHHIEFGVEFKDMLSSMFTLSDEDEDFDDEDNFI